MTDGRERDESIGEKAWVVYALKGMVQILAGTVLAMTAGIAVEARDDAVRPAQWMEAAKRQVGDVQRAQRAARLRWEYERRRSGAHARMPSTLYASTPDRAATELSCPVPVDQDARRIWRKHLDRRDRLDAWDAGPARSPRSRSSAINVLSASRDGGATAPFSRDAAKGALSGHGVPAGGRTPSGDASSGASAEHVHLFPSASEPFRQGLVRVINHSGEAGDVRIEPVDDSGRGFDPVTLSMDAHATVHFNSGDLENGNPGKGLTGHTGPGQGNWRLAFTSDLDIEVLAYVGTPDGFLAAMHDVAPADGNVRRVAIFNPGSERSQASQLRLVNPTDAAAEVVIRGTDDRGVPGAGEVVLTLDAGTAREVTAAELESGAAGLGDGYGKWRLEVVSEQPIVAMSLLESPTGHLTNLSTVPPLPKDGRHAAPLFPAAADPSGRQGFLRLVNRTDRAGEVRIEAFDETDWNYEPLTVMIGSGEALHLDSDDLEQGNPRKGLPVGTGAGEGNWRLELTSELDVEVLAYIRNPDGFLTAMHDVAPSAGNTHRVPVFNPGSDRNQASLLRLVNPGDEAIQVTVSAIDGRGDSGVGRVSVTVPAGRSKTLTGWELEDGGADLEGALGDGAGKWRLALTSDGPVMAMSLLRSPTGHLTNLSTAPAGARGKGVPGEETAEDVFGDSISPIVQSKCVNCHVEGGASGNTRLVFVRAADDEEHLATNLAVFEALLGEVEDGAELILSKIQGVSHGGGIQIAAGTDEFADVGRFLSLLGEDVAPVSITPDTLFDGVRMMSARSVLRRAAIVFAGRVPTEAEYTSIRADGWTSLRAAIRGLMEGQAFHDFLIRGSNDRLLTDRDESVIDASASDDFVELANLYYEKVRNHYESGGPDPWQWHSRVQYGFRRAPLELIAHVVENDLPYTEVLAADYIMANRWAAEAYGASTEFRNADDVHEFRPAEIASYYRDGPSKVSEFFTAAQLGSQATLVKDPGDLATDYPHAGILNTTVFLLRYPTTATNRNRARSRWTYYHFLGVDIEKSASRTTEPVALADTNNPTMNNPACTACHTVMDPVAGAFQNYGNEGNFRDQWHGMDSLDEFYKQYHGTPRAIRGATWTERATLSWPRLSFQAGPEMLVLTYTNDFYDKASRVDGRIYLDRLDVVDARQTVVLSREFEEIGPPYNEKGGHYCGGRRHNPETGKEDHIDLWNGGRKCAFNVELDMPTDGIYDIEVVAWAEPHELYGDDGLARIAVAANPYQDGDTWDRDMREPGFGGEGVPDADSSLQWLPQKIVANPRFAEAAVRFWWQAIMGSEVAVPPEDETDTDFEGRLLASNAQAAEVNRLAAGFRRGFRGGPAYNLKDLLVEIVLSRWFRARSLAGSDPVRTVALAAAGARRLLTPEELSRKTVALTGFDWQRRKPTKWNGPGEPLNWTRTADGYGLLYGGIDSGGITKRGRDLTSVMAGVAQRHATATACPTVMKDFYLVAKDERRLFGGVDLGDSPVSEFEAAYEIEATSRNERETLSVTGPLRAGRVTVRLYFANDFWDEALGDRNVLVDKLTVRRREGGAAVHSFEFEEGSYDCGGAGNDHWNIWSECSIEASFNIAKEGSYDVQVVAWADQAGDELAKLHVSVESDTNRSAGSRAIKAELAALHAIILGVDVDASSADVQEAYDLFVDVWQRGRDSGDGNFLSLRCDYGDDDHYFDGIADDIWREELDENGNPLGWDWDRVSTHLDTMDMSDPNHVARTWVVVLAYLMTDPRYLHL